MDALTIGKILSQACHDVNSGQRVTITAYGVSMLPLIGNMTDRVVLGPVSADELCVDDVVVFHYHGRLLLHRIVAINGDNLTIQGDGVLRWQERVVKADVVARAEKVVRSNGKVFVCGEPSWKQLSARWKATPFLVKYVVLHTLHLYQKIKKKLC
ncbi:MAG: S24/S26 family peptidase [Mucinivorans sp.]